MPPSLSLPSPFLPSLSLRSAILNAMRPAACATALAPASALLALTFATANTHAAEGSEQILPTIKAQDSVEAAPAVTQVGKVPQLLRDVPQTITVISRETLDAQGATSLNDALRNVPGITLSAGEGGVIGDNVNLRGYSARTDLYIDGMRDRGQYSRDTFFVESVEVLKGPSSMLFGRGSTGGVINQVSKQARRQEIADVSASVGTNSYYRAAMDLNRSLGEHAGVRVAAFGHSNESTRDVVESERYGIAPSLRFGIGQPTEIAINAIVQRRDDIPDYGLPLAVGEQRTPPDDRRSKFYGFTDDRYKQDVNLVSARITHEFSPALTLRNQTQLSRVDIHALPTRISTAGVRDRLEREIEDGTTYNQTDAIIKFATGSLHHTLTTGIEFGRDDFENQNYTITGEPNQSLGSPVYGPMPSNVVRTKNTFTDARGLTQAAYANEQLDIGDHWKAVAGVRWDRYEFETTVNNSTTGVTTLDFAQIDKMTSVRGGLIYQPSTVQTYYVSYGTSFNPSAETLTISAANQNLPPEKNRSYELGGKWNFNGDALFLTAAVFRVEKQNARTNDPLLGVTLDGNTRVQGFETGLSGKLTEAWFAQVGYTYLDGEIVSLTESSTANNVTTYTKRDGNVLTNTPKHSASLWSTYDFPFRLQIGGGLTYATDRQTNNANTVSIAGYVRVDATVAYVTDRYSVRLNLQNLADRNYYEVASGGRATPSQGRTVLASLNWKL